MSYIKIFAQSDGEEDLGGSAEGDIPWKVGPNSSGDRKFPGGNASSGKKHNDRKHTDHPSDADHTRGTTNNTQLEAKKTAQLEDHTLSQMLVDFLNTGEPHQGMVLADFLRENYHESYADVLSGRIREMKPDMGAEYIKVAFLDPVESGVYRVPNTEFMLFEEKGRWGILPPERTVEAMKKRSQGNEEMLQVFTDYLLDSGLRITVANYPDQSNIQVDHLNLDEIQNIRSRFNTFIEEINYVLLHTESGQSWIVPIDYEHNGKNILETARDSDEIGIAYAEILINIPYDVLQARVEGRMMNKEALHLKMDPNLRGSVNYVVETHGIPWKDIESIEYMEVPKTAVNLEEFPKSLREDGIVIFHANTPKLKAQGLQHVEGSDFPNNALMVFYKTASSPFHMNNVKFPIDIIWADEKGTVLAVKEMKPGGLGYYPPIGTVHAIETNVGWAEKNGVAVGDRLTGIIEGEDNSLEFFQD